MTFQEKFDQLRMETQIRTDEYLKADKELSSINGFFDIALLADLTEARRKFEVAMNNYHNFLFLAKEKGTNPSDVYSPY